MNLEVSKLLRETVWIDPDRMAGKPCLMGTRFPISSIIAQLADGESIKTIADEFDLDEVQINRFLSGLAMVLDQPCEVARQLHKKKF